MLRKYFKLETFPIHVRTVRQNRPYPATSQIKNSFHHIYQEIKKSFRSKAYFPITLLLLHRPQIEGCSI